MAQQVSRTGRQRVQEVAEEFIERDLLPEDVEAQVIEKLDEGEPRRALQIVLHYRKD